MVKGLIIAALLFCSNAQAFLPKSFTAHFEQVRKSIISGKVKKSAGAIEYKYPSNLRLEITGAESLLLVSNSKKTWYYRPPFMEGEKGELTVNDSGKTELSGFFDILKSGLVSGPLYRITIKGNTVELRFTKAGILRSGLKSAVLDFKGKTLFTNLSAIHIVQKTDKKLTLNLSKIVTNVKLSPKRFIFTTPKNL